MVVVIDFGELQLSSPATGVGRVEWSWGESLVDIALPSANRVAGAANAARRLIALLIVRKTWSCRNFGLFFEP